MTLANVKPVGSPEQLPVEVPQVVAGAVSLVLGEFRRASAAGMHVSAREQVTRNYLAS